MCFDTRVHSRFFLTLPRSPWAKMMLSCICYLIFVWVTKADFFLHLLTRTIGTEKIATESASEKRRRMEMKIMNELVFNRLATLLTCRVLPLSFDLCFYPAWGQPVDLDCFHEQVSWEPRFWHLQTFTWFWCLIEVLSYIVNIVQQTGLPPSELSSPDVMQHRYPAS